VKHAAPLVLLPLLAACASLGDAGPPLPEVRFAGGGAYTDPARMFDAPSSPADFEMAVNLWTDAVADAGACGFPSGDVMTARLVGAAELAFMGAASRTGERRGEGADMARYAADMALAAAGQDRRPSRARCSRIARWLPEVNRQGGAAMRQGVTGVLRDMLGTRQGRP